MKTYKLEITDRDGEVHEYILQKNNPWDALNEVYREMMLDQNWYGHKPSETVKIEINELV